MVSNPDKTKVIALTQHCAKDGTPKIVKECSLPITGARAVSMIVTDLAVFDVDRKAGELTLIDIAEGIFVRDDIGQGLASLAAGESRGIPDAIVEDFVTTYAFEIEAI